MKSSEGGGGRGGWAWLRYAWGRCWMDICLVAIKRNTEEEEAEEEEEEKVWCDRSLCSEELLHRQL